MPIRNRTFALIYRLIALGVGIFTCVLLFSSGSSNGFQQLAYFGTESSLAAVIIIVLEVIFNLIDLIRHGNSGVAAYVYMPLTLGVLSLLLSDAVCYSIISPFLGGYSQGTPLLTTIFSHAVLPFMFFLDYLLFDEKGTVPWKNGIYWMAYPVFYFAFTMAAHYIFNSSYFPYKFLDAAKFVNRGGFLAGNDGWNGVVLSVGLLAVGLVGAGFLTIFLNNLLSGKYKKR